MFAVSTVPEHAQTPASTPLPGRFTPSNDPHDFLKTQDFFDPLFKEETDKMSSKLRERVKDLGSSELAGRQEVLAELLAQIDRAEKLTELRNSIVHGVWSRNKTGGAVKLRDTKNNKLDPMPTVKQLRQAEREIDELLQELNRSRLKGKLKEALL